MAQIIEAGTYRAKAVEGALGETSTGKEQVAVVFDLLDAGQKITWYGYFTDKTLESTFRALRTAGWTGQDLSDLSTLSREDVPEVHLVVEHEDDKEGQPRARVRWVNSTGGMGLKSALAPDKAKAFAARMRGAVASFDRNAGPALKAPATPAVKPKASTRDMPLRRAPEPDGVPQEVLDAQQDEGEPGESLPF